MKANLVVGVAASAFVVFLGMTMVAADQNRPGQLWDRDDDHDRDARVQAGLKYAREQGIHLNLQHRNREVVGLGSYLVNAVGGCNDCHTAPPFTLDPMTGLGAETDQQRVLSGRRLAVRSPAVRAASRVAGVARHHAV